MLKSVRLLTSSTWNSAKFMISTRVQTDFHKQIHKSTILRLSEDFFFPIWGGKVLLTFWNDRYSMYCYLSEGSVCQFCSFRCFDEFNPRWPEKIMNISCILYYVWSFFIQMKSCDYFCYTLSVEEEWMQLECNWWIGCVHE